MKPREKWQYDVECALCHDVIYSRYSGEYLSCKCGAIAIDQTPHYCRYIGEPKNFIFPKDQNET